MRETTAATQQFLDRLQLIPAPARKLLCVIVRQAWHGTLRSKPPGVVTMPEIHEACGLDVDQMYGILQALQDARLITVAGQYPFEEIRLEEGALLRSILERCEASGTPLEELLVGGA